MSRDGGKRYEPLSRQLLGQEGLPSHCTVPWTDGVDASRYLDLGLLPRVVEGLNRGGGVGGRRSGHGV
jgi:hypothetical protein